ncbi:hypothetical protein FDI90_gp117 [Pseudomonas phage PA7]|uniref:Uncharacterized protein n=1 Tax=Pseudomonas phage PA7 TaxID=347330 RepID=I7CD89_9CAUD|nr:hypothetical protein FDI90_gp117 [Pseudomonas phage PA7]QOV08137.1 hypothetical protein [Pseudomonas phage vB_PaeM_kmuB]WNV47955.1 hypothetical protein [Pseudomonas phage fMGyn-Pae01]BDR24963.1 hypothetical protein RVBP14_1290 [Pseudomonas phage sp. Brmt]BDR25486.1 hypothetical protein RVBP15_2900 [Pseudomonas phage sp. 30-1]AFO70924.1 hypothetical protein [Pseudomonas phage PA7]
MIEFLNKDNFFSWGAVVGGALLQYFENGKLEGGYDIFKFGGDADGLIITGGITHRKNIGILCGQGDDEDLFLVFVISNTNSPYVVWYYDIYKDNEGISFTNASPTSGRIFKSDTDENNDLSISQLLKVVKHLVDERVRLNKNIVNSPGYEIIEEDKDFQL